MSGGESLAPRQETRELRTRILRARLGRGPHDRDRVPWAEGRSERFVEIAAEFVRLKVDVILTHNTRPVLAAKQATSTIPIVFATAGDPIGTGVVTSLAQPGGNVTGLSSQQPDTASKRLELLREMIPSLQQLAILADAGNPYTALDVGEIKRAASALGLEMSTFDIRLAKDIGPAFETLKTRAQALYVPPTPIMFGNRDRISALALEARLPTVHGVREYVEADIPVEQPTKFDFILNLKTAKSLGLAIPPTLLARPDEVIE